MIASRLATILAATWLLGACGSKSTPVPPQNALSVDGVAIQVSCIAAGESIAVPVTGADVCDGQLLLGYTNVTAQTAHLRVARRELDGTVIIGKVIPLPPIEGGTPLTSELLDRAGAVHALYLSITAQPQDASALNKAITSKTLAPRYERPPPFQ